MARKGGHYFIWILIYIVFQVTLSFTCTFPPDLVGTFDSTVEGTLHFNSTSYGPFTINTQSQAFPNLMYGCHIKSETTYVSRSTIFTIFSNDFYAYMCLHIHQVSSKLYYYYYGTQILPQANGVRVKIYPISQVVGSLNMICDEPNPHQQPYSILFKNDSVIEEEMISCPVDLQGYFNYVLDDGVTTTCENKTTLLDTCTNNSTLSYDYNTCNHTVMYSENGTLFCLFYNELSSGVYYITLYNGDTTVDNTNTYRYTCLVFERGSSVSYATQYPLQCQNSTVMNSTTVPSPGGSLTLTHNGSCPLPTTASTIPPITTPVAASTSSASVTWGIVGGVASLSILVVVIVLHTKFKKKESEKKENDKKTKKTKKAQKSTKVEPAKRGVDRNSRPMFTPAPPRIYGDPKKDPSYIIDLESEGDIPPSLEKEYTLPIYSDYGDHSELSPEPTLDKLPSNQLNDSGIVLSTPAPESTSPPDIPRSTSVAHNFKDRTTPVYGPHFNPVKDTEL